MHNLLANAIHHIGPDGCVALRVKPQPDAAVRVEMCIRDRHHIFAFCQADARVHRCGKAGVCLVLHQRVARAAHIAAGNGQALVCGAVVDDDKFKVLLRLRPDRFNGIAQPARAVQIRYYNTCLLYTSRCV